MTTSTCRICGQPVHRYSPDHPGTPDDLMGCVNSLRGALEEADASLREIAKSPPSNAWVRARRALERKGGRCDAVPATCGFGLCQLCRGNPA